MTARYKVEVTRSAQSDIREICSYISRDNPLAAQQWLIEIEHQIDSLEKFPFRCPIIPESHELGREYRHLVSGNYRTIFKIAVKRVIIMRVFHGPRLLDMEIFK